MRFRGRRATRSFRDIQPVFGVKGAPSWNIVGRTVVVTGAARGIGADAARRLHGAGMNVVLAGLEPDRLETLRRTLGSRALVAECDVTSRPELERMAEEAIARFGRIDVLVANAGVSAVGSVETSDVIAWERVIEINLLGVVRTVRAVLPHVVAQQGYVLPVASLAAALPIPLGAHYTAAKHGVSGFARALRAELVSSGTEVGCAYFGFVDTDLVRRSMTDPAMAPTAAAMPPGSLGRPISVERAGAAIARAVARRSRAVYAPRWIQPIVVAPGLFTPLVERATASVTAEAVRISNERDRAGGRGVETFVEPTAGERRASP